MSEIHASQFLHVSPDATLSMIGPSCGVWRCRIASFQVLGIWTSGRQIYLDLDLPPLHRFTPYELHMYRIKLLDSAKCWCSIGRLGRGLSEGFSTSKVSMFWRSGTANISQGTTRNHNTPMVSMVFQCNHRACCDAWWCVMMMGEKELVTEDVFVYGRANGT